MFALSSLVGQFSKNMVCGKTAGRRRPNGGESLYVPWTVRNTQGSIKHSFGSCDWGLGARLVGKHVLSLTGGGTAWNSLSFPAQTGCRHNGKMLQTPFTNNSMF